MIKRLMVLITVMAALVTTSGVAYAGEKIRAEAELAPIGSSGISAEITFVDNPAAKTLTIRGEAEGLDPTKTYFSLLYNVGSPSVGPNPCEPTNDSINFIQMLVGFWSVNADGEGRLFTVKSMAGNSNLMANAQLLAQLGFPPVANVPSYVGLDKIGNMSVRDVNAGFVVRACGDILTDD